MDPLRCHLRPDVHLRLLPQQPRRSSTRRPLPQYVSSRCLTLSVSDPPLVSYSSLCHPLHMGPSDCSVAQHAQQSYRPQLQPFRRHLMGRPLQGSAARLDSLLARHDHHPDLRRYVLSSRRSPVSILAHPLTLNSSSPRIYQAASSSAQWRSQRPSSMAQVQASSAGSLRSPPWSSNSCGFWPGSVQSGSESISQAFKR